jgi:hypothetical protein
MQVMVTSNVRFGDLIIVLDRGIVESHVRMPGRLHERITSRLRKESDNSDSPGGQPADDEWNDFVSDQLFARFVALSPHVPAWFIFEYFAIQMAEFGEAELIKVAGNALPTPPADRASRQYAWWFLLGRIGYMHRQVRRLRRSRRH